MTDNDLIMSSNYIDMKHPLRRLHPDAIPIKDNTVTVISIKTINDKTYGYTGWYINGMPDYQFIILPSVRLADILMSTQFIISPFVIEKGELMIPLGSVSLHERMYDQFRIVPIMKTSFSYDE